jgi:hypothetical protein
MAAATRKEQTRIRELIKSGERQVVEFKLSLSSRKPQKICKEIAAFLTTGAGTIFIGVSDDRQIIGLDNPSVDIGKIENWAYEFISPVASFEAYPLLIDGKNIVVIEVKKGNSLLYAYDGRLYGRIGTSSVILKNKHIEELIRGQSLEQTIESLKANVAASYSVAVAAQSQAVSNKNSIAPGIIGQGELATMQYAQIREKLFSDLTNSPLVSGINSGIAIAQSLASVAAVSVAPAIVGQCDLATTSYSELKKRLNDDLEMLGVIQKLKGDVLVAQASAATASASAALANMRADQAIQKVEKLLIKLKSIGE